MKQKRQNLKRKASQITVDAAASCFLALFFSFFFVYAQTLDFAPAAPEVSANFSNTKTFHGAHLIAQHHSPLHLPVGSLPIPESETKTEKEGSDNIDDEAGKLFAQVSLSERSDISSRKSLLLQLINGRHNRKEVSLFILYHSWKSYLS